MYIIIYRVNASVVGGLPPPFPPQEFVVRRRRRRRRLSCLVDRLPISKAPPVQDRLLDYPLPTKYAILIAS